MSTADLFKNNVLLQCVDCEGDITVASAARHGLIYLQGEEDAYFGSTCPGCMSTSLGKVKKEDIPLGLMELLQPRQSSIIPTPQPLPYRPEEISYTMDSVDEVLLDTDTGFSKSSHDLYYSSISPTDPYPDLPSFESVSFTEEEITRNLELENETKSKVFPRYFFQDDLYDVIYEFWYTFFAEPKLHEVANSIPGIKVVNKKIPGPKREVDQVTNYLNIISMNPDIDSNNSMPSSFNELINEIRYFVDAEYGSVDNQSLDKELPAEFHQKLEMIWKNSKKEHVNERIIMEASELIGEFINLANKIDFSFDKLWDLKDNYFERIYRYIKTEALADADFAFYQEGASWTIIFDSKKTSGLKGKGFSFLHHLIKHKRKSFKPLELSSIIYPLDLSEEDKSIIEDVKMKFEQDDEILFSNETDYSSQSNKNKNSSQSPRMDDIIDKKARQEFINRRDDLKIMLSQIDRVKDKEKYQNLYQEYKNIEKILRETTFGKDKIHKFKTMHSDAKDRIGISIKRALNAIKAHDPKAHDHFKRNIRPYSDELLYNPVEDIEWES